MDNAKISIIIPIYNVEDYLDDCLKSCENQTLKEIEVVLVNDGSTDRSEEIMNNYIERNPSIFSGYTIENGGLGNARNYGIKKATGEYIAFVDSDDMISNIFCELQYNLAKQYDADIVRSDYKRFEKLPKIIAYMIDTEQKSSRFADYIEENGEVREELDVDLQLLIWHTACMGIYRKSLIDKLDFKFPVGKFEDPIMKVLFLYANKIALVPKRLYFYRNREGSITSEVKFEDRDIAFDHWREVLDKYEEKGALKNSGILESFFVTAAAYSLITYYLHHDDMKEVIRRKNLGLYDKYMKFYKHIDPEVKMVPKNKKGVSRWLYVNAIKSFYKGNIRLAKILIDFDYSFNGFNKRRKKRFKKIARTFKKYKRKIMAKNKVRNKLRKWTNLYCYPYHYHKTAVIDNYVLLEAYHGKNFNGNIYYLGKELDKLNKYKIFIASNSEVDISDFNNVTIIKHRSQEYYKLLACAKYIFNNTSFPNPFIKKDSQIVVNTWHGTPLKTLGNDMKIDRYKFGNIQRTVGLSNLMILSNAFTIEKMLKTHGLEKTLGNRTFELPSPRNSIFFDDESEQEIRKKYNLINKKVVVYMPTWRGSVWQAKDINEFLMDTVKELADSLTDEYEIFVKFHSNNDSFRFDEYEKVKYFPSDCETYKFLNVADVLVTDYSSVMFDYALKNRKIILYCPDVEEYIKDRNMYFNIRELGFSFTENMAEVIDIITKDENRKFEWVNNEFNKHDSINGAQEALNFIMNYNEEKDSKVSQDILFLGKISEKFLNANTKSLLEKDYLAVFSAKINTYLKTVIDDFLESYEYYPYVGSAPIRFIRRRLYKIFIRNRGIARLIKMNQFLLDNTKLDSDRIFGHININVFVMAAKLTKKYRYFLETVEAKQKYVLLNESYVVNFSEHKKIIINEMFERCDKILIDETDGIDYSILLDGYSEKVLSYEKFVDSLGE